jgi:GntR family transcriptional regulator
MEIAIQKGTNISLHQQLVTQISMQIAAGILKPGVKLSSIRLMSQKLGIHHNTCLSAYRELEVKGLIEIRHGSGARVASLGADARRSILSPQNSEPTGLVALAEFFVHQALQQGYLWEEALAELEKTRQALSQQVFQPLIFVDIHLDILGVFQAELQEALQRPVQATTLNRLNPDSERLSHFLVSRYHYQALKEKLARAWGDSNNNWDTPRLADCITVIDVGAVSQELDFIRQLPPDSMVAVISSSSIILQQAEAVISALRGDSLITRTLLAGQEPLAETERVLKRAHVIFADWLCAPQLKAMTRKPIHTIRTIPQHELTKLQAFQAQSEAKPNL